MGTKTTKTKLPLRAWRELCRQITTLNRMREEGKDQMLLYVWQQRINGLLDGITSCVDLSADEYMRLQNAAHYAMHGKEL